jgi:hypothetical protein
MDHASTGAEPEPARFAANTDRDRTRVAIGSAALAAPLLAGVIYALFCYPLPPQPLAAVLTCYAVLLWFRPSAWLVVIPLVVPTADLTPWTGWLYIQESDLFAALTVAILLLRAPPARADFAIGRGSARVLLFLVVTYLISLGLGFRHLPDVPDVSDNPYLDVHNALRLAKGLVIPLALLPFLGRAFRTRRDAFMLLSWGMILGLLLVSAAAIFERYVFVDIFDLAVVYRVVSTFSSMHLGGGQIGAYLAMTLPFLTIGVMPRRRLLRIAVALIAGVAGGFTLITTFSRTDAVAAVFAICVLTLFYAAAATAQRPKPTLRRAIIAGAGGVVAVSVLLAAASSEFMRHRLSVIARDLITREDNWSSGFAVRERGLLATLFGSGLGSYPRIFAARNREDLAPEPFTVRRQDGEAFLTLGSGEPIYIGQKVAVVPDTTYTFSVALRFADAEGDLEVFLCEKWLLYSIRCESGDIQPETPGKWETYSVPIESGRIGDSGHGSWLRRPVDLAFSQEPDQSPVDIRDVRLIDPQGRNLVANGDFKAGTERWLVTDDDHRSWRMHDQYLTVLFEGGCFGLIAFLVLAGWTLLRTARACLLGFREGAVVAASLSAFLVSGIFDYLTEAPRLATLFYLLCFSGFWIGRPAAGASANRSND